MLPSLLEAFHTPRVIGKEILTVEIFNFFPPSRLALLTEYKVLRKQEGRELGNCLQYQKSTLAFLFILFPFNDLDEKLKKVLNPIVMKENCTADVTLSFCDDGRLVVEAGGYSKV